MLIVSDTSPLRTLQSLGLLELLEPLYSRVLIPPAVAAELKAPAPRVQPLAVETLRFISVRTPTRVPSDPRLTDLGPGEQQAIALALEVAAATLLIDDSDVRRATTACGVPTTGVLGVLIQAKRRGLIPAVSPLIQQLQTAIAFRISQRVILETLRQAGEAEP